MSTSGHLLGRLSARGAVNPHTTSLMGLVVIVGLLFSIINPKVYPSVLNMQSMAYALPEIGLLSLAVCVTMSTGGIDLSIVATANLSAITLAAVSGWQSSPAGLMTPVAVLAALAVGGACGAVNGLLVTRARIAPILATLASMQVYAGLAVLATKGKPLSSAPNAVLALGTKTEAGVPVAFVVLLLAAALLWLIVNKTAFGWRLIFVGASATAATYSGIQPRKVLLRTYLLAGLVSGLAGVMMLAHSAYASADYGSSYLLLAITIAVLGGTDPFGGRGPVLGVLVASLLLQMVSSGFDIQGISPYMFQATQGLILAGVLVAASRRGGLGRLRRRAKLAPT
jgi:simple sugar transport system permease protein